jgi:hypothetical protein
MKKIFISAALVMFAVVINSCQKQESTYTVTYDGNENTSGTVPVDSQTYSQGQTVAVLDNTGGLTKTGSTFGGWNTNFDGTGTSYAAESAFAMGNADVTLYAQWPYNGVGQTGPAGGYVFYDKGSYSNGWRYMEAAPSDQSTGIIWANTFSTTGANGTVLGTGKSNTASIVASLGTGSYAAQLCNDFILNGFSDWFLPSMDELTAIQTNLVNNNIGGFTTTGWYWSSREVSSTDVTVWQFGYGTSHFPKNYSIYVRAIREY